MPIVIRDARPEDKESILAFTQHTWSWGDDVPRALDDWLGDEHGVLRVAEDEHGSVTAIQHYQPLDTTQVWLSGLRVHPDHQGRGLARALLEDAIRMARSERMLTLRYASEVTNEAIQRLSQEFDAAPRDMAQLRAGDGRSRMRSGSQQGYPR